MLCGARVRVARCGVRGRRCGFRGTAHAVAEVADATDVLRRPRRKYLYPLAAPFAEKLRAVAQTIYGADDVDFTSEATAEPAYRRRGLRGAAGVHCEDPSFALG